MDGNFDNDNYNYENYDDANFPLLSCLQGNTTNCTTLEMYYYFYRYGNTNDDTDIATDINRLVLVVPIVFGIILLIGMIGNGLVMFVVLRHGRMKTVINIFLLNLAVADTMFLVLSIPYTIWYYVKQYWPFGLLLCKVANYLMVSSMAVSVLTLAAMSVDRYYSVVHPIKSKVFRTIKHTVIALAVTWLLALSILSPVLVVTSTHKIHGADSSETILCSVMWETDDRQVYVVSLFVALYMVPLMVIAFTYCAMAKTLKSKINPLPIRLTDATSKALKYRRKFAKMVLVIVIAFGVCWLPIHVFYLRLYFGEDSYTEAFLVFKIVALVLSYLNSAVNPIIYAFWSKNFRKCLQESFTCRKNRLPAVFAVHGDPEEIPIPQELRVPRQTRVRISSENLRSSESNV